MRTHDQEITIDPLSEAQRYVDNAREILKERGKLDEELMMESKAKESATKDSEWPMKS